MVEQYSRRHWLRRAITGAVAIVALTAPTSHAAETEAAKAKPKIIVLGAGMSGVMAANTLYEKGYTDVTIIEANDYIGGRMKQGNVGGRKVELGANWVHGQGGNPIYDLAASKKLTLVETNWSSVAMLPQNPKWDTEVEEFDAAFEKAEERAKRYLDKGKKDMTVSDAMRYEGWVPHTPLEAALLYNEMDLDMGPARETSFELAMNIATYDEDEKDFLVVDSKGYNSLAHDLLAKNFPNPLQNSRVILNTFVDKIAYSATGVSVTAKNRKTNAVTTYKADYVITTFSAGVLRNRALTLFSPRLPEDKLDVIFRVDMTRFIKVFVETTERFWASTTKGAETWIYADKVTGNFTSWVDMSIPKLGTSFSSPKNASYVALAMLGGDFAARYEQLSDADAKSEVIKVLRAMFPSAAARIDAKTVASVTAHKWGVDELYGGSWSNPRPGFSQSDFVKLGEPVGRVYFSGEHTSVKYFGYVHGAYRAGIDTANQLIAKIGK